MDIEENINNKIVYKSEIYRNLATELDMPVSDIQLVCDKLFENILTNVNDRGVVTIQNFGRFYKQKHKGHRTQFSDDKFKIDDYLVLKFSAARYASSYLK